MGLAFNSDRCLFFVGGDDTKANNTSGDNGTNENGGCTEQWWLGKLTRTVDTYGPIGSVSQVGDGDYNTLAGVALTALMETNGDAKYSDSDVTFTGIDAFTTQIDSTEPLAFDGVEVGMIVYVEDNGLDLQHGPGLYEVIAVEGIADQWIQIATEFLGDNTATNAVRVGGAWNDFDTLAQEITTPKYSQQIWCNKDFTLEYSPASVAYDCSAWGYGDSAENVALALRFFNRYPGDITDVNGGDFESIKTVDDADGSATAKSWGTIDMTNRPTQDCFDFSGVEGFILEGCRVINQTTGDAYNCTTVLARNLVLRHCLAISGATWVYDFNDVEGLLILDCYAKSTVNCILLTDVVGGFVVRCISRNAGTGQAILYQAASTGAVIECIADGYEAPIVPYQDAQVLAINNTCLGGLNASAGIRSGGTVSAPSTVFSINNLFLAEQAATPAYAFINSESYGYGWIWGYKDCCYDVVGDSVLDNLVSNPIGDDLGIIDSPLEEDPALDAFEEPLNVNVREYGKDILNDPKSLGAVNAMNMTAIETAAENAINTKFDFTGGDVKATLDSETVTLAASQPNYAPSKAGDAMDLVTDALDADAVKADAVAEITAGVDTTAVKLASDGLDSVVVAEPSGDPDGWSFAKKLLWLTMRFLNKHTSDNFNGIQTHKADGTVSTTQTVTDANGVKTVEKAQ